MLTEGSIGRVQSVNSTPDSVSIATADETADQLLAGNMDTFSWQCTVQDVQNEGEKDIKGILNGQEVSVRFIRYNKLHGDIYEGTIDGQPLSSIKAKMLFDKLLPHAQAKDLSH